MTAPPPPPSNVLRDVAEIAETPGHHGQMAEVLARVRRVVPVQAAWLALLDDRHRRYTELASFGYDGRILDYFGTTPMLDQVELVGLTNSALPQRAQESPVPLNELPVWADYYFPAGFRAGMAVGLFTPDRRHVGVLVLCTDDPEHPTEAERDLVAAIARPVAAAVDPIRSLAVLAQVVRDAGAAAVLTRAGEARPLPGLPGHRLLAPDSALPGIALHQASHCGGSASFLWPTDLGPDHDDRSGLLQVTVLGCPTAPPSVVGILVLSPLPGGRSVLTRRELVTVGLLLEGWSDEHIAVGLDLPLGSVAETIARVVVGLDAPDRHTALLRAARQGWFIPPRPGRPPQG
ncbi:GAF domain-containing protein [Plantactinospora sp. B6F1]|uniref:GAF domain-containing protein n=1 Tax=Plantactinospora sp. B6F1 TaxID=3158971 RepID=UPI0032D8D784